MLYSFLVLFYGGRVLEAKKTPLFNRDFILVMIAAMGASFVNYFFFSSLSLFAEKLTGTVAFAGLLSLAYSATALVMRPVSGIISDRQGRVRLLIVGSALGAVACMLYSFTTSLVLLMMIRVLNGVGMSMNTTSAGAAVPDIVPRERMAEGVGIFGLYATVAQAVGPFIALAIVGNGEFSDFNRLFYVSAAFCGVSFICACFVRYERDKKNEPQSKREDVAVQETDEPEGRVIFGFDVRVFGPSLVMMLYFFGISSILSFLTLYGKNRGFQVEHLGWFFLVSASGLLCARLIFGRIVDRRGGDVVVIPGLIVIALCLFAIPMMPTLPLLICVAFPYGVASGAVSPSINAIMFRRCSVKRRGTVSAAYFASVDIGITLGAPIMGWLADRLNFTWVFWLSAAVVGVTILIYVFFVSDRVFERRKATSRAQ